MSTDPSTDNPDVDHEESDVDVSGILKFGGGLLVLGIIVHVLIWGVLVFLDRSQSVTTRDFPMAAGETRLPPGPRLQVAPREDMRALQARDEEHLSTYGWVDRELGVVRMPIDVAMRLTLERGLPVRSEAAAEPTGAPQP